MYFQKKNKDNIENKENLFDAEIERLSVCFIIPNKFRYFT